jgi:NAD(P)H-quinone oxidoreductase subunit 5
MNHLFHFDALSLVMVCLIGFIGLVVMSFSSRYLQGDRKKNKFFILTVSLMLSVAVLVSADYLPLFLLAWALSNWLLSRLMLHKIEWAAARASANLALINFGLGLISLTLGLTMLALHSQTIYLSQLDLSQLNTQAQFISGTFLLIAAMTQSAIWPFHRWLLSSLNSPTPVSAFMHAGLVNGGGFLLARFAPLFLGHSELLQLIFVVGAITALLGTWWKLMQHDVKRMLACSTMAQMGFMIAECGLGLFAAAISHLIWHGMFKAYLFLNSGSAAQEKRISPAAPPSVYQLLLALTFGLAGTFCFALASGNSLVPANTSVIIHILALVACSQGALTIMQSISKLRWILSLLASLIIGAIYGLNLTVVEWILAPMQIHQPQSMLAIHWLVIGLMVVAWLLMLFRTSVQQSNWLPSWRLKLYVRMLNASQPHAKTITAHRNHYHY